ncbi:MAG: hypothetical protein MK215_04680, partial [Candidatus Poseidoniia archaeon]|nr:hypothetical protein [Candidatus Poseidoniia archaeon]
WDSDEFMWTIITTYTSTDYWRSSTTNSQEHVAFAVAYTNTFTPVGGSDYFKAVTDDDNPRQGTSWDRNPTPASDEGDYTTGATTIPEFSTLQMPIASVILIVGYNHRLKRKYSNQH